MDEIKRNWLLLEEVFNATGHWLYGSEWDREELLALEIESPEALRDKRRPIESNITELEEREKALKEELSRTVSDERIQKIKQERANNLEKRGVFADQLRDIGEPTTSYVGAYARYERRQHTEKVIIDALASGELKGNCFKGFQVPKEYWAGRERRFRYYLDLSIVVVPDTFAARRRYSLRIAKREFYDWIKGVAPIRVDPETPLSPKVQAIMWLREAAKNPTQPKSKSQFEEELRAEISGLSQRGFNEVWAQEAPAHWRKPGRRSQND